MQKGKNNPLKINMHISEDTYFENMKKYGLKNYENFIQNSNPL